MKEEMIINKLTRAYIELKRLSEKNIFFYGALFKESLALYKMAMRAKGNWAKNIVGQAFSEINLGQKDVAMAYRKFFKLIRPAIEAAQKNEEIVQKTLWD